jgi:Ni/Fe-hydrogenase subunit HybB-like protein
MFYYLLACYMLSALVLTSISFERGALRNMDVLMFFLAPCAIPITVAVKVASHFVDLDAPAC